MANSYANLFAGRNASTRVQKMSNPIEGRESEMVQTRGGGYAFKLDNIAAIRRFLILGATHTYYASQQSMTVANAQVILDALKAGHGADIVALIEDVNTAKVSEIDTGDDEELRPAAAPRKKASIFALALCQVYADKKDQKTRQAVHNAIRNRVVISTLRQMYDFLNDIYILTGGWNKGRLLSGTGIKRAIAEWFVGTEGNYRGDRWLANQLVKYRNGSYVAGKQTEYEGDNKAETKRHEINALDVLRSMHVKPRNKVQDQLFAWVTRRDKVIEVQGADAAYKGIAAVAAQHKSPALDLVAAFEEAQITDSPKRIIELIHQNGLSWEAIPNGWFSESRDGIVNTVVRANIWRALLGLETTGVMASTPATDEHGKARYSMGLTALVRNLPRLANYGLLNEMGNDVSRLIVETLTGKDATRNLVAARVHPIRLLSALRVYGRGYTERLDRTSYFDRMRRDMEWKVNSKVEKALEDAFYASFGTVGSSGVRQGYFLDISGSMGSGEIAGVPALTPRDATAVLAMVCSRNEDQYLIRGFGNTLVDLPIKATMSLEEVTNKISGLNFGSTDCSLPAKWSLDNRIELDCFTIMTDNELNTGYHPTQALENYRQKMGIDVRQIVVGMTATDYTIADPNDPRQMDICGFDATAPQLMQEFSKGNI